MNYCSLKTNTGFLELNTALPMTTASRTTGVAPLAVFFDAVDNVSPAWTSGVEQPSDGDYASYYYVWYFGDPTSGKWEHGRQNPNGTYPSKNSATGYTSAHVFENPGTYNVTLRVKDATDNIFLYQQTITVTAFSGTTYYVSATGSDSNDGLSTSTPFLTFSKGKSMATTNRQILFKRGDTFNTTALVNLSADGPGIFGAYGTGDRPKIVTTGGDLFYLNTRSDWRIMDLEITGNKTGKGYYQGKDNNLLLRCILSGHTDGVNVDTTCSNVAVMDCNVTDNKQYGAFFAGGGTSGTANRIAVMGCLFDQVDLYHLLRTYVYKGVISNNYFQRATGLQLKFCAQLESYLPNEVRYGIIADNKFSNSGAANWLVGLGPENVEPTTTATMRDIVIENNIWEFPTQTTAKRAITANGGDRITLRNNLFVGLTYPIAVGPVVPGFGTLNNWRIYNNTFYRPQNPDTEDTFFIYIASGVTATNFSLYNNIVLMPNATGWARVIYSNTTPASQFVCNHNNWRIPNETIKIELAGTTYTFAQWQSLGKDANSITTDPLLVNPGSGDLRLQSGSPAKDTGTNLSYVRTDHDNMPRPYGVSTDMGAFEYRP